MSEVLSTRPQKIICPWCQGIVTLPAERCWLCCEKLPKLEDLPPSSFIKTRQDTEKAAGAHQFSLASIMLLVTLLCVFLGLLTIAPGMAVLLAVLAFFAWVRTTELSERRQEIGLSATPGQRIVWFLGSVTAYVLILTLIAATGAATLVTAFLVICLPLVGDTPKAAQLALALAVMIFGALGVVGMKMLSSKVRRRWLGETNTKRN